MKTVLISIKPEMCKLIANKEKTIEVRKTAPKEVPFRAYIYQRRCKTGIAYGFKEWARSGKVIGEFVCDKMYYVASPRYPHDGYIFEELDTLNRFDLLADTCLLYYELDDYLNDQDGYGWHITDLKIYDKPKDLSEFGVKCNTANAIRCRDCIVNTDWDSICEKMIKPLTRPPISWQYINE